MKQFLRKLYEILAYIFIGIATGMVIAFELLKGSIHNQSFTFKKTKVKGQDNDLDVTTSTVQTQSTSQTKNKLSKRKRIKKHRKP